MTHTVVTKEARSRELTCVRGKVDGSIVIEREADDILVAFIGLSDNVQVREVVDGTMC